MYKGGGRGVEVGRGLRGEERLTQRTSRRCCCSLQFCMCSCKNRIKLVGIVRLFDRNWCGRSIGHRPLEGTEGQFFLSSG